LNGTLPSELYALSSLEVLSILGGSLQGTIPSSFGKLTRLDLLQLGDNLLTGSFPESFADLRRLQYLHMSDNELTGSIPTILSLESMSLSYNFLSGTIPGSVTFENLRYSYLSFNMISGNIPESFLSPTLEVLKLWETHINGSRSSRIGDLVQMSQLDLSNNDLTGTIPSEIGKLIKLESLYLDGNSFNGTIPSQMGLLTRLVDDLWLAGNQLSGTVPVELASLSAASLTLFANNLTGSLDMFCNQTAIFTKIDADCAGVEPAVECPCCTSCCDSLSGNCTVNGEAVCLAEKSWFANETGPDYYESGGTVCECTTGSDNNHGIATLSCMDTQCQSCNLNGTVCSVNKRYQYSYDENGYHMYFHSTFQYVVGRNDTVTLELTILPDFTFICEVAVNGQVCNECFFARCRDQFSGIMVNCENVEEAGSVDFCHPEPNDADGPLAVFALQDPAFLQGCPPRIY
jgi:Leucine-rich repeat (LRR) protein